MGLNADNFRLFWSIVEMEWNQEDGDLEAQQQHVSAQGDDNMSRKHDRSADLRAIADGRLMLNVRNGVTVPRSMLAMIADEIDALRAAPITPAEVGGNADAQTEARAIARCVRGCATDDQYIELVERIATALAAKDAELAKVKAELFQSRNFWSEELSAKNAQLAEANKALEEIAARPGKMIWGEDHEVRDAMHDMEDAAYAFIARRAREQGGE